MSHFREFPLLPSLQDTLSEKDYQTPTEIQQKAIPALLGGRSVVGISETGSGKTLAFALPILHGLKSLENAKDPIRVQSRPRALVVVPTRELGEQVSRVFKPFTHTTRLRVRTLLGGTAFEVARRSVNGCFEVLVATPGRLVKLLEMGLLDLSDVRTLVLDEADQMIDQGFLPDTRRIVKACPENVQKALFSATVSPQVQALLNDLFADAEVIRSEGSHKKVGGLTTKNETIVDGKRLPVLEKYLEQGVEGGTILFTNTRAQCDKLAAELSRLGKSAVVYRGEMDKVERRRNLKNFREGKVEFLISTDLASRGLDVEHVGRVMNYHLPMQMENYIHRVGRTARAGRTGLVVNFVTERDQEFMTEVASFEKRAGASLEKKVAFKKPTKIVPAGVIRAVGTRPSQPAKGPQTRIVLKKRT